MVDEAVIEITKRYAELVCRSFSVREVILYGSQAEGRAGEDSDIDVAVVFDKEPEQNWLDLGADLFSLSMQVDIRIEPLAFVEGRDRSGFLHHIRSNGIKIY